MVLRHRALTDGVAARSLSGRIPSVRLCHDLDLSSRNSGLCNRGGAIQSCVKHRLTASTLLSDADPPYLTGTVLTLTLLPGACRSSLLGKYCGLQSNTSQLKCDSVTFPAASASGYWFTATIA